MTKNEYLAQLLKALENNGVSDAADIISEYEQHFVFKMADGYAEEEIVEKLGDPVMLAGQYERSLEPQPTLVKRILTAVGLFIFDIAAMILFILLVAWDTLVVVFSLASLLLSACLFGQLNVKALIPSMPYACAVTLGVSALAMAVLGGAAAIFFTAFLRQLVRSYRRFHHNAMASSAGKASLPLLTIYPQFKAKARRRLRAVVLTFLTLFAVSLVLAIILCILLAGHFAFWHEWGWFTTAGRPF